MIVYYLLKGKKSREVTAVIIINDEQSTHAHGGSKQADSVDSQHICMAIYKI